MSFQDLLKQPLPSKLNNRCIVSEGVAIKDIDYVKTTSQQIQDIFIGRLRKNKEMIKSIKEKIKSGQFEKAIQDISTYRNEINTEYKKMDNLIKSVESKGFTKKTTWQTMYDFKNSTNDDKTDDDTIKGKINNAISKGKQFGKDAIKATINLGPVARSYSKFIGIYTTYKKYYDGILKTLDELEDKCEKQSQNIKECLIDFIIASQDMEILLESSEEIDYINEE
jgi:hypothetical protein